MAEKVITDFKKARDDFSDAVNAEKVKSPTLTELKDQTKALADEAAAAQVSKQRICQRHP